jgi:biopolymer transport protein ExbB/TolQ
MATMTSPSARPGPSAGPAGTPARQAGSLLPALLGGVPLGIAAVELVLRTPLAESVAGRYLRHPVQWAVVVMFCCAVSALAAKLWQYLRERAACARTRLPAWDGKPAPVAEAGQLLAALNQLPAWVRRSSVARRAVAVLDFLCRRGTTAELDDHLRALADADADALDNSYGLVRFITWAVPILGFLGTVLGITAAIAGVTPDKLEHDITSVTDGLAEAFDTTALALGFTMVAMFLTYVVNRLEQGVLERIDRFIDHHLAHRFARAGGSGGAVPEAVVGALEDLVRRQADLWARTVEEVANRRADEDKRQQERLAAALDTALERTLEAHAGRVADLQRQATERGAALVEQIAGLAAAVRQTGQEQQAALARVAEGVMAQAKVLGQLQAGERQLLKLEEALAQNLAVLENAQTLEQAVHSLTAAAHLLTARAAPDARPSRLGPRPAA